MCVCVLVWCKCVAVSCGCSVVFGGMCTESQHCSHLAFCSCLSRMLSRRWGLGMKAMSPPSFTSLPIHQSLLYFWEGMRRGRSCVKDACPGRALGSWHKEGRGRTKERGMASPNRAARFKPQAVALQRVECRMSRETTGYLVTLPSDLDTGLRTKPSLRLVGTLESGPV